MVRCLTALLPIFYIEFITRHSSLVFPRNSTGEKFYFFPKSVNPNTALSVSPLHVLMCIFHPNLTRQLSHWESEYEPIYMPWLFIIIISPFTTAQSNPRCFLTGIGLRCCGQFLQFQEALETQASRHAGSNSRWFFFSLQPSYFHHYSNYLTCYGFHTDLNVCLSFFPLSLFHSRGGKGGGGSDINRMLFFSDPGRPVNQQHALTRHSIANSILQS